MPVLGEFFKLVYIEDITYVSAEKVSGIMPVLGDFFKLVGIEDITYLSMDRPVELCQYLGTSLNWYV